jgi:hypothetical protein
VEEEEDEDDYDSEEDEDYDDRPRKAKKAKVSNFILNEAGHCTHMSILSCVLFFVMHCSGHTSVKVTASWSQTFILA